MGASVLAELERYYDAVPRSSARVEQIGALTLFIGTGPGWGFYARPTLGVSLVFAADDVAQVRARQRALGIPQTFEWVAETTPAMHAAVSATGLAIVEYPLMVLGEHVPPPTPLGAGLEVRLAHLDDDFALLAAVGPLAFGAPGTAVGPAGVAEVRALAARTDPARARAEFNRERVGRGPHGHGGRVRRRRASWHRRPSAGRSGDRGGRAWAWCRRFVGRASARR